MRSAGLFRGLGLRRTLWAGCFVALVVVVAGCGGEDRTAGANYMKPLAVADAVAVEDGSRVAVRGILLGNGRGLRLCSTILESYPPQCGGEYLMVEGMVTEDIVGLTANSAGSNDPVYWSDQPRTLVGVKHGGSLRVEERPAAAEAESGKVRVRFAYAPQPLAMAGGATWLFDVANNSGESLTLMFRSGQKAEIILSQAGKEVYRFSSEKVFSQAIEEVTIDGYAQWGFALEDEAVLSAGTLQGVARIMTNLPVLPDLCLEVMVE